MAYFEVIVQYTSGNAAKGIRVQSSWDSHDHYTDDRGKAVIEADAHDIEVFVQGRSQGRVKPGKTLVTISS